MELAIKLLAGAVIGGALGLLVGRAKVCSASQCNVRANIALSMLGGAVFGAGVAWWLIHRT